METYILEFSRYFIVLLAGLYMLESFLVFRFKTEEERNGIYIRQNVLMFLMHFTCFLHMCLETGNVDYIFFFAFQQVALYTTIVLYHLIYPTANRLVVNNMCFIIAVGFVILARLDYDKAMRQFVILVISASICLIIPELISRIENLKDLKFLYGGAGLAGLLMVLIAGTVTNGSHLMFSLFGVTLQPSEFIKILYVLCIASILYKDVSFVKIGISAIVAGLHVMILVLSKDLGSGLIYFVAYIMMVFVATGKLRYLLAGISGGTAASMLAYRLFSHVRIRVRAWQDPWSEIEGAGYQVTQSLFAIGCGGWFGLGLFKGSPASIPYVTTDFIFSAITEEMGLLFSLVLILIYLSCFVMFMRIALEMSNSFYRITAVGLSITYIFQVFLTIGGDVKFIPLTGVTLPLISYGGSSILSTLILFSIIQGLYVMAGKENIDEKNRTERQEAEEPKAPKKRRQTRLGAKTFRSERPLRRVERSGGRSGSRSPKKRNHRDYD